jgi:signal transduction histidine kinase
MPFMSVRSTFGSIRWRLILGSLLVIIVPLGLCAYWGGKALWSFYVTDLEHQLEVHGRLIADAAADDLDPLTPNYPGLEAALVRRWRQQSHIRLTLCDHDGKITAAPDDADIGKHISEDLQPGLADALAGHANSTTWKSPNFGYQDTMYVNLPVMVGQRIVGGVRVAYSLAEIQRRTAQGRSIFLWSAAIYGLVVLVSTVLLGTGLARPIEKLNEQVSHLARGDLEHPIHVNGPWEIELLAETTNDMRVRLRSLEELRRRHVADVSHEFRTPLAAIRSMAETVDIHGDDDPIIRSKFLRGIVSQADRLAAFADQLLDLAQIESGRMAFHFSPLRLDEVVRRALASINTVVLEKGLHLDTHLQSVELLAADAQRLTQVILNLLSNAVRHTPAGGTIRVSCGMRDGQAELIIADTGCGIEPQHLPHIFERYYRADPSRSSGGAGLGLCIVREIVDGHGGRIDVRSHPGEGACFTILLPCGGNTNGGPQLAENHAGRG